MYSHRLTALSTLRVALLAACVGFSFLFFSQNAQAANTVSASVYQDTDGNGTINRIRWTMDENVTACTYEAGDWTVNTASEMNFSITGLTCAGNDTFLYITVSADSNETGASTAPVISYSNGDGDNSVTLTSGAMTAKASQSTSDAAAPTVVSTSPISAAVGVTLNSDISITFSEAMDTTFAEATEFAVSPDPGSFSASWASGNTVLTLTTPTLLCNTTYTVTTTEAQIDASAGSATTLVTTGAQDGDWSFTTNSCSSNTSTPARVTSFEYAGPLCTEANTHSFTVVGTNISAYLASADELFTDAEWQEKNIEGTATIDLTVEDGDDMAYLVLKSDSEMNSNVFSFELDNWNSACAADESEDEDEAAEDEADEEDEDDVIVPVSGVSPGDVIHSTSSSAVYYVTETYGRRVFINEQTFFTWFDSFDVVKEVSESTLSALPLQGSMLPKAGVVLVKIQSANDVYFLDQGSEYLVPELRVVRDEDMAIDLFGADWADYVIDVEPTFFTKFATGMEVEVGEDLDLDLDDMKKRTELHE